MSDIDLDDVPAETPLSPDEAILRRHKREKKELQGKILAMKKTITKTDKKKKKELAEEIAKLEADMEARHKSELTAFRPQKQDVADLKDETANVVSEKSSSTGYTHTDSHDEDAEITGTAKLSKAQKRREKKAALEKERNKRVELETALLTEGADWKIEDEKLATILNGMNLQVYDIPSDGHCLYRAVAHQLQLDSDETYTVEELRTKTAQHLIDNKNEFVNFLGESESNSSKNYEDYCDDIKSTAAWGGQIELKALSQLLKRPIKVIQADGPPLLFNKDYSTEVLTLTYHRHKFKLGAHYNSAIRATGDNFADGEFQQA